MSTEPSTGGPLGQLLRGWRAARGMSQMALAMRAGFSARHLSFIETGRSRPSRQALLDIAEALEVPLRERNLLLEAGGYAHLYRRTPLAAEEMRHIRGVLQFILDRHEPYCAMVLDRYGNLMMANRAAARLLGALVDPSFLSGRPNLLRIVLHPRGLRNVILNWEEVAIRVLERAERELRSLQEDEVAKNLLTEIAGYAGPSARRPAAAPLHPADLLMPVHVRINDVDLRLFTTIMTIGTPKDVTLQELRIETLFPADEESEKVLKALAG